MTEAQVILETRDLSRHFGGLKAVDGVNLQIYQGELHSIIGPNGAGKTTLFNLLSSTLKPTRGRVFFKGRDITHLPPYRMAHLGIGRSYQITNIFPSLTVFENVRVAVQALGKHNFNPLTPIEQFQEYREQALEALELTGLTHVAAVPALALSHGDKRKLELAILLAQNPELLLLDEPTSGLAGEDVPEFMQLIERIHRQGQKTTVLVEHNMNVVMSLSDRITVMHQGQILAVGTPQEISQNPEVQKAYLGEMYAGIEQAGPGGEMA
ncbi:MAG: ABC transporter ATP-binding protein [Caldilineae bacterium]|nr:MAG: ABC transporter ATP-binding protein [Caldilineae bacterium]